MVHASVGPTVKTEGGQRRGEAMLYDMLRIWVRGFPAISDSRELFEKYVNVKINWDMDTIEARDENPF